MSEGAIEKDFPSVGCQIGLGADNDYLAKRICSYRGAWKWVSHAAGNKGAYHSIYEFYVPDPSGVMENYESPASRLSLNQHFTLYAVEIGRREVVQPERDLMQRLPVKGVEFEGLVR